MSEYSGNIRDLPVVTGGHFIENSTKKIVFGPDGRFWNDYVMRLFTLEPEAVLQAAVLPDGLRPQVRQVLDAHGFGGAGMVEGTVSGFFDR